MAYNGRKGPNVSEYIANLNAIPSEQDLQAQEGISFEDDLSMFTNTTFFEDFDDLGQSPDLQAVGFGIDETTQMPVSNTGDVKPMFGK